MTGDVRPVHLGKLDPDVDLVEGELANGELVQPAPAAIPVDDVDPLPYGWMAERRGRLAAAPPVLPEWLRDRGVFADTAGFVARYYAREAGHHAVRAPVYVGRLWVRAPRGAGRVGRRWFRWVTDAEARPVEASAAASADPAVWARHVTIQTKRTGPRRRLSITVAVPVALLVILAAILLPHWALAVAAAGIMSALGLAGQDADKPIIKRYVAVQLQRRLDSTEIERALEAIGIKGTVDFVAPIAVDGPGWLAELDLPGAHEAQEVLEKRSKLAAAMRRPLGCVWPEGDKDAHPGRLRLWVAREDPAKAQRRLWPLLTEGQADLFGDIPYGFDPRGRLVTLRLMGSNVLLGGVMGSGKTSAVLTIALAGALDPTCEEWIYELKGSGDLEALKPVCHAYVSGDDDEDCKAALDALRQLEQDMNRRKAVVKALPVSDVPDGRKVSRRLAARKELGLHPILAIFDEAHTLFEHPEYGEAAAEIAGRLIRKARAYGIIIVFTTQKPDAKSIPRMISDNAITRLLLAVTGHTPNDIIAGTGAYKRGVRGTMFDPERDAGTAWLVRGLTAKIVRAAFIKQVEAIRIVRRAHALRIAAGNLTGQAAGEDAPDLDQSDLIDDVRAVWPAGDDAVHSYRLVQALSAYRPDRYETWVQDDQAATSTTLANALKPYGVTTRQINRRGAGGGGKGVRWDDLPARKESATHA